MSIFNLFSKKLTSGLSNEKEGEKYFRQALQCYQYGNQDDAIKFFTKSLEISPNHSAVYVNRAGCYMVQERYLQAYDDYLHAIDMEDRGCSIDAKSSKPAAMQSMQRIQPLIAFAQQNGDGVKSQLTTDGLEHFTKRWAEVLFDQFLDNDVDTVKQFILEEIKELEEMGGEHQEYALNCGVNHSDFSNVGGQFNTQKAFVMFKSVLCCFSREPHKMFEIRTTILNKLMSISNSHNSGSSNQKVNYDGRMRLVEAEVDIMFIVKNSTVMYINNDADSLYELDKDGDMKLDGRIVNFIFKDSNEVVEIFVAFDDQDSYSMFTMNIGRDERLNYVAQAIFQFMGKNNITNVFSLTAQYSSQYHYTFKLYKKNEKYFMVNNSQSHAYLIGDNIYKSNNADEIKSEFWSPQLAAPEQGSSDVKNTLDDIYKCGNAPLGVKKCIGGSPSQGIKANKTEAKKQSANCKKKQEEEIQKWLAVFNEEDEVEERKKRLAAEKNKEQEEIKRLAFEREKEQEEIIKQQKFKLMKRVRFLDAIKCSDIELVKTMIKNGFKPEDVEEENISLIAIAKREGDEGIEQLLSNHNFS